MTEAPQPDAPQPEAPEQPSLPWSARLEQRFAAGLARLEARADEAAEEPVRAVHEFRKELRRLRSLARLLRSALPAEDLAPVEAQLRSAFLRTNAHRDSDVLRDVLKGSGVGKAGRRALLRAFARSAEPEAVEGSEGAAAGAAAAGGGGTSIPGHVQPAEDAHSALVAASSTVREAAEALAEVLGEGLNEEALRAGVARRRERAVRAWKRVGSQGRDEDVHDWRKRAKEVRYGLEWLAEEGAADPRAARPWARLARRLGRVTDLLILLDAIDGLPAAQAKAVRRVRKDIRRRVRRRTRKVLREERELMERAAR